MTDRGKTRFRAIAVGVSAGGMTTLKVLLGALPTTFPLPVLVVQHMLADSGDSLAPLLDQLCPIRVKEADEGEEPVGGTVYLAPANYHLLVERDGRLALSTDPPVNYARPSVDVLFETAAEAWGRRLIGVVLTGAGSDGSLGLKRVKEMGGVAVVQAPDDAVVPSMPAHAMTTVQADYLVTLRELPRLMEGLAQEEDV